MVPKGERAAIVVQPLQASVGYGWRMGHGREGIEDSDQAHRAAVFEAIAAAENG